LYAENAVSSKLETLSKIYMENQKAKIIQTARSALDRAHSNVITALKELQSGRPSGTTAEHDADAHDYYGYAVIELTYIRNKISESMRDLEKIDADLYIRVTR
jgi:hypothetical protein